MINLDSILKSGDITLPTNVFVVKAMVFPVVMYETDVLPTALRGQMVSGHVWMWELDYKESWVPKN